jgi:DNA-binding NtrC family response regulator
MTDQRMPQMTGVEMLRQARLSCPEAVRIIFTGYADIRAVIDAINEGQVYRFLTKPWDPDELLAILRQACARYDQITERRRLLSDVRQFLGRCQPLLQERTDAADGGELLARLDRFLAQEQPGEA